MSQPSQFRLLASRRFLPFFLVQLLGAFNDNVYKQALILAILYKLGTTGDPHLLVNLCALLFILPFLLFSALGGQLGEKYPKERMIRLLKLGEVLLMLAGAAGLLLGSLPLMLLVLFGMGTQSALFGPVKYSILPQHLAERELVGGNGLVETGTFLAILGGTLFAGLLMAGEAYAGWVSVAVVALALAGLLVSLWIPRAAAACPTLRPGWNLWRDTQGILRIGFGQSPAVSGALIGNSWFWFLGATYLTQIPAYARDVLGGDETAVTLVLALFSIGIALGSLLCERLSARRVEPGLVPLGALGLSLFGMLLWWASGGVLAAAAARDWLALLGDARAWGVIASILGLGLFGGVYIVPLYALIQARSAEHQRSRVIAAGNILNALFMVGSALLAIALLSLVGLTVPQLFLAVSLLNLTVTAGLLRSVPEFGTRFVGWLRRERPA